MGKSRASRASCFTQLRGVSSCCKRRPGGLTRETAEQRAYQGFGRSAAMRPARNAVNSAS